jgi:hypothetical protein
MATWETRYLGDVVNRPSPEPLPRWQDCDGTDLWVAERFSIMVHVLNDTTRHAGHADILREQLDGQTVVAAGQREQIDTIAREAHRANIERVARAVSQARN